MSSNEASVDEIFVFTALLFGTLCSYTLSRALKRFAVPYTVVIFSVGIILSLISYSVVKTQSHYDSFIISIVQWENIDPYLFLYVFLPPLLFGEAMTLNIHHLFNTITSSLLLALPGAIFGAYLTALSCLYMLPYNWPWTLCFLVGTVLCSTDPVSVIAILKQEVNTSISLSRLTYLIIGESMLNDASSLVLFDLVSRKSSSNPINEYVIYFTRVIFISPCIGCAIGLAGVMCLRYFNRRISFEDSTMQIAITLVTAYVSFFLGQSVLFVSGIVSCCAAGIMFSWFGTSLLLQPLSVEVVWSSFVWIGETLVFSITGLLVGRIIVYDYVEPIDVLSAIIIYFVISVVRLIVVVTCFPFIKYMSPLFSFRHAIFLAFSGIRGTTSLALVLILNGLVYKNNISSSLLLFDDRDIHRAVLICCIVVALTLAVNGTLSGRVLVHLNIKPANSSEEDGIINRYVLKRIEVGVRRINDHLNVSFSPIKEDLVKSLCSILQSDNPSLESFYSVHEKVENPSNIVSVSEEQANNTNEFLQLPVGEYFSSASIFADDPKNPGYKRYKLRANSNPAQRRDVYSAMNDELMMKVRKIFLEILRKNILKQILSGHLPRGSNAGLMLLSCIDQALETTNTQGLHDWDGLKNALKWNEFWYKTLRKAAFGWKVVESLIDEIYITDRVSCLNSYLEAHTYARSKICVYLGEYDHVDTPEEELVINESSNNTDQAMKLLAAIDSDTVELIKSKMAARIILHKQEDMILHFVEEGILPIKDAEAMFDSVLNDQSKINSYRTQIQAVSI